MRYFRVDKEELTGMLVSGEIFSDGEYVELPNDTEARTITTGFSVWKYKENGETIGVEYYPVEIYADSWTTNEEEVLEQIKQDFPAGEWQNDRW